MALDLQSIIPYIQEDSLDKVSLTLLLQMLANPSLINLASQVDQQTLLVRVTTLLKSNHSITRWKATKLLTICLLHPVLLLSNNTANSIGALVKILESKCFIANHENPTEKEIMTLRSTVDCIGFLLDQIRGKPTLTREVLTPKLPAIIASLIDITILVPENALAVLSKLLLANTTTFRPFGTKFENVLRAILNNGDNLNKMDDKLRSMLMKSLALVSFVLAREKQAEVWRDNVNNVVLELKSVISIYEACLELSNDDDYNTKYHSLPNLPENFSAMKLVFGTLSIDINESPIEIFKVSQRIKALTEFLLAYIEVNPPFAVSIPFGHYILLGQILSSFNTNFTAVKKDIRDAATREMIEQAVNESKLSGIRILNTLVRRFSCDMYPHMYNILAILDASIPVQTVKGKIRVHERAIYENEVLINEVLQTACRYLELSERFNDMTILGRLVESALILKEPREPAFSVDSNKSAAPGSVNMGGNKRKNNKNKSIVSLSDILSHKQLFVNPPSDATLCTVRKFFNVLITKCELSAGKLSSIVRFVIIDAVANIELLKEGKVDNENRQVITLLESVLLFPGKTEASVSVIPIISNLIGKNSRIYSLLVNPRFPLLPQKHSNVNCRREIEEIEEEEEREAEEFENGESTVPSEETNKRSASEVEFDETANTESKRKHVAEVSQQVSAEHQDLVFNNNQVASAALKELEYELKEEKTHGTASLAANIVEDTAIAEDNNLVDDVRDEDEAEDDEDIGSDFEIPQINVDDE